MVLLEGVSFESAASVATNEERLIQLDADLLGDDLTSAVGRLLKQ